MTEGLLPAATKVVSVFLFRFNSLTASGSLLHGLGKQVCQQTISTFSHSVQESFSCSCAISAVCICNLSFLKKMTTYLKQFSKA